MAGFGKYEAGDVVDALNDRRVDTSGIGVSFPRWQLDLMASSRINRARADLVAAQRGDTAACARIAAALGIDTKRRGGR